MTTTPRANPYVPALTPLPPITVKGRLDRLRDGFDEHEIDALVVTTLANVRYLTGFSGSAGVLAVTRDAALLTTDGRYRTQSAEQIERAGAAAKVEIVIGPVAEQRAAVKLLLGGEADTDRVGLEADNVTWNAQLVWADLVGGERLIPTSNAVEALRARKDEAEIVRMERAAAIADAALFEVLPLMGQGVTEEHFALELDTAMRRGGAESTAFDTIVAAGENSAKPHHHPGGRQINRGDPVVVDFGATFEGYRSDMTRTFCVDAEPEGELARIFEVVRTSQAAGAEAVRPGIEREGSGRCLPGDHRGGRLGRALRARHGTRRRARHSRGPDRVAAGHCYPRSRLRRHRRARRVRSRARRRPCRGHPRRDRGRRTPPDPIHKGHPWQSRPMT